MSAALWLAVAVLVVGWMLWPPGPRRWPVVLVTGNDPGWLEGAVRTIAARGRVVAVVGPAGGEVESIVQRLIRSECPVLGLCDSIEQAMDACEGAAALVIRPSDRGSLRDLLRHV